MICIVFIDWWLIDWLTDLNLDCKKVTHIQGLQTSQKSLSIMSSERPLSEFVIPLICKVKNKFEVRYIVLLSIYIRYIVLFVKIINAYVILSFYKTNIRYIVVERNLTGGKMAVYVRFLIGGYHRSAKNAVLRRSG